MARTFRKLPLTTKDINKGFYKGTGTGSMGSHTKFGGYIIDWQKVRTYVVPPGLDSFKVRINLEAEADRWCARTGRRYRESPKMRTHGGRVRIATDLRSCQHHELDMERC